MVRPAAPDLRSTRIAAGLTQEQLAARVGVTPQAVSQWETCATVPVGPSRILLAQVFELPIDVVDGWFARAEEIA
jgi:transcriptional regulator with XRE-family HTH domain